jgi:hypothetical protein
MLYVHYEIIEQRRTMDYEQSQLIDPTQITRRDVFTLAVVSPSILTTMRRGSPSAGIIEEILSEATASVTTCGVHSVILTTYAVDVDRSELDTFIEDVVRVHPWEHPVIECIGPEGPLVWFPD